VSFSGHCVQCDVVLVVCVCVLFSVALVLIIAVTVGFGPLILVIVIVIVIILRSLLLARRSIERSAIGTDHSFHTSVGPHMLAVATRVIGSGCRLGW